MRRRDSYARESRVLIRFIPRNIKGGWSYLEIRGRPGPSGCGFWCSTRPEMSCSMRVIRYHTSIPHIGRAEGLAALTQSNILVLSLLRRSMGISLQARYSLACVVTM